MQDLPELPGQQGLKALPAGDEDELEDLPELA